ncbi:MAG: EF-P lysine aminoacylase GenX [Proteobacteria bacterium]|nr:EF-P lysine aminoacylase GenX [Pseudomonadota bacterium]
MISRDEYLKKHWIPYPTARQGHDCGRWLNCKRSKALLKTLDGPISALDILVDGDWVSVDPVTHEVTLLAPQWEALPSPQGLHTQEAWAKFLRTTRHFFEERDFHEIWTPTLVRNPGTEPYLDLFETEFRQGQQCRKFFLPTSPELHLKKALAMGLPQIFEIKNCFRNGEVSVHHSPEFLMLEWYRAFAGLEQIQSDVVAWIKDCTAQLAVDPPKRVTQMTMAELWKKILDFDLTPTTSREELMRLAQELDLYFSEIDSWDEVFFRIFLEKVEPWIPHEELFFLRNYPSSQAALARISEDGWGERFEFYWKGMELGNAFHELNDPQLQRQRTLEDLSLKEKLGKTVPPVDEEFFLALRSGMPPSSGIAVGFERVFLALLNLKSLDQIRLFKIY